MTVLFTEEEREWLDRKEFNWSLKPDCPESLVKPIKAKLALIYEQGLPSSDSNNHDAETAEQKALSESHP